MICCNTLTLEYYPNFLTQNEADFYFNQFIDDICWQHESYFMFGKKVMAPRLIAWYGNDDAVYLYSGKVHHPIPWTKNLHQLKQFIESFTHETFNSVLLNLYRNGQDSMGWHADNEKELGKNPVIASISLGANRKMYFRDNQSKRVISLELAHGSLLLMQGHIQDNFKHSLPKIKRVAEPRINLTFRLIGSEL